MPAEEDEVRYTRVLEDFNSFAEAEVVYSGLLAAIAFIKHTHPGCEILSTLAKAARHRRDELKEHYEGQKYRENPG